MAASTPVDIASTLAMEDIPIKLRCAICNKLALNAFRLPCCDQSICETCQSALPDTCPVCEHSPVAADDCKPHKALRTTIKVFLKTEEKKRESRGRSESINTMPVTNGTPLAIAEPAKDQPPSSTPAPTSRAGEKDLADTVDQREEISMQESAQSQTRGSETLEAEKDIPRPSTEGTVEGENLETSKALNTTAEPVADHPKENSPNDERRPSVADEQTAANNEDQLGPNGQWGNASIPSQMPSFANGGMFNDPNGAFPNAGWNGSDFNPMMQPMPMTMANGGWGPFPNMMGAPGMNMDPMAMSQGMFGGYGGQDGMGMNGMNGMSGMTMGMGFDAGQGGYGMWDGNAGWNANQDKFNPNANGSHTAGMGAPFGANAGFASSNGYNVQSSHPGNFNQLPLQPFPNNNFQSGFNGPDYRRSSGFGLGGQGPSQGQNASAHNVADDSEAFHHQLPPGFQPQSSQKLQPQQDMPSEPQGENGGETETKSNDADAEKGADANQKKAEENMPEGLVPVDETNGEPKGADTEETKSENASSDAVQQNGGPSSQKGTPVQHSATIGVQRSISGTPPVGPGPMQTNPIPTVPMSQVMPTDSMPPMGSMGPMGPMGPMMPMAGPMGPMGPTGMYPAGPDQFFAGRGRGMNGGFYHGGPNHFRGNLRGRGGFGPGPMGPGHGMDFSGMPQGPPRGMGVAGAPTAPKALRQGLPNTSVLRNRSFGIGGRASQSQTPGVDSSAEQQQQDSQQQKSPPADDVAALESQNSPDQKMPGDNKPAELPPRPRSRSRSPEGDRELSRRSYRHRSRSVSGSEADHSQSRNESRLQNGHKSKQVENAVLEGPGITDTKESRLRDASVASSKRSAHHRSRRERDRERERENERGRERDYHESSHKHSSSHHRSSRRDRDRDRDRSKGRSSHRRRRSRSPETSAHLDGERTASYRNGTDSAAATREARSLTPSRSSRKRAAGERSRSRHRDREREHDHKRSRRDRSATPANDYEYDKHRSSGRSRRDEKQKAKDRSSDKQRDRDRDRDRRDRDKEREKEKRRDRAVREKEKEKEKPSRQDVDQHTLEREARNRERLLKEQQRREQLKQERERNNKERERRRGKPRTERDRDDYRDDADGGGRRRVSYKYENDESEEARAARIEDEREAARWG